MVVTILNLAQYPFNQLPVRQAILDALNGNDIVSVGEQNEAPIDNTPTGLVLPTQQKYMDPRYANMRYTVNDAAANAMPAGRVIQPPVARECWGLRPARDSWTTILGVTKVSSQSGGPEGDGRDDPSPGTGSQANRVTHKANSSTAIAAQSGGSSAWPARLARWRAIVRKSCARFVEDRCSTSAWSLACRGFLAIFPAVIALLGLVRLTHLSTSATHKLTVSIHKVMPPEASRVVTQAITSARRESARESVIALAGGILVAVWSVAGGISTLQIALDLAYEVPHDRRFIARRLRSLWLMLATVILGLVASGLSVFGAAVGHSIQSHFSLGGTLFSIVWTAARWLATAAVTVVLLELCYYYGPNRKPRWRWISPGSVIGAAIFIAASLGFSFYVTNFSSYGKIYGAFTGAVILIFWLYLGGLAVLFGAELNAVVERAVAS